jgi:S-(hydroxymethyl)glutathione dehydrogenase/alcohol dehydrogenase
MKTKAAVLHGVGQDWQIEEIEVDPPQAGELLVEWKAAGLCHSDEHLVTGDLVPPEEAWEMMGIDSFWPFIGGHEGAGVVAEVGPGVTSVEVGDHVSASFIPSCGRCRYCSTGRQSLCDDGATAFAKGMVTDGTHRHRTADGEPLNLVTNLGTFSGHTVVAESQVIKVEPDLPFDAVSLVSCGVATGWGSATKRAAVGPGDTVVVVGIGGIGINAVQGAAMAGARHVIAVDPLEFKREKAMEFGATHTAASMTEALPLITDVTWGTMANKVVMTMGVGSGAVMAEALALTAKRGRVVVTNIHPAMEVSATMSLLDVTLMEKQVVGSLFGSGNPRADIPKLLGLYREGQLDLDGLVTNEYTLDGVNDGYDAMRAGTNIRGVMVYD